LRTLLAFSILT